MEISNKNNFIFKSLIEKVTKGCVSTFSIHSGVLNLIQEELIS